MSWLAHWDARSCRRRSSTCSGTQSCSRRWLHLAEAQRDEEHGRATPTHAPQHLLLMDDDGSVSVNDSPPALRFRLTRQARLLTRRTQNIHRLLGRAVLVDPLVVAEEAILAYQAAVHAWSLALWPSSGGRWRVGVARLEGHVVRRCGAR